MNEVSNQNFQTLFTLSFIHHFIHLSIIHLFTNSHITKSPENSQDMFSRFASSLNQLALGFKKAVTSIFVKIDEESSFEASLCPRRFSGQPSNLNILSFLSSPDEKIYENILEPQTPEKNPSRSLNLTTTVQQKSSGEYTELTFGRVNESSQRQTEMSYNTASFKRYDDSSYEILPHHFSRRSPQGSQLFFAKVSQMRVINYWKKIYKESSYGYFGEFNLDMDIITPLPIRSTKPCVEFRYNKRTKTYEAVRLGLKRKYADISLREEESAMSLESEIKDSEQLILKKPKLETQAERERKTPITFQSRRKLTRKVENLRAKINL
jgi:hypothetical protein